jgi:hypothetical protein
LESSWLKSPRLKGLGLKLGVEKFGVEMSFNRLPLSQIPLQIPSPNCLANVINLMSNPRLTCDTTKLLVGGS